MKNQIAQYSELMPANLEQKIKLAKYLSDSGLMPQGLKSPAQVLVALQMGHELGLAPMVAVNNISVIRGRPTLSAQIMDAIVRSHPDFAGLSVDTSDEKATVTIKRKIGDNIETYTSTFSLEDAKRAGLFPGKVDSAWATYPQRMLKHRALAFAARDAFPDALAGMDTREEVLDMVNKKVPPRDVTPESAPDSIKSGGDDVEIAYDELEKMLSEDDIKSINASNAEMESYAKANYDNLESKHLEYILGAREKAIRAYFKTGELHPAVAIQKVIDRLRDIVEETKKKKAAPDSKESEWKADAEDADVVDNAIPENKNESSRSGDEAPTENGQEPDISDEVNALDAEKEDKDGLF